MPFPLQRLNLQREARWFSSVVKNHIAGNKTPPSDPPTPASNMQDKAAVAQLKLRTILAKRRQ